MASRPASPTAPAPPSAPAAPDPPAPPRAPQAPADVQAPVEAHIITGLTVAILRDYASFLTMTDGLRVVPPTVQAAFMKVRPDLQAFSLPALAADLRTMADVMEKGHA